MILSGILDGISDGVKSTVCFTDRAYIKIDGKRIKRTTTSDIIDNIMQENVGNKVEISSRHSLLFGNILYAIKEQNGEINKIGILNLIFMMLIRFLAWMIVYGIAYGIFFAIMVANYYDDSFITYLPLVLFLYPFFALVRDILNRNKLK